MQAHPTTNSNKHGMPGHLDFRAGWYILRVRGGKEFEAEETLFDSGWEVFLPRECKWQPALWRRKRAPVDYPRFPGYLFVALTQWPDLRARPFSAWALGILGSNGRPLALAAGEIGRLRTEAAQAATSIHRAFGPGEAVRIITGAFRGRMAVIETIDETGAHMAVELLQRPAEVTLPLTWLEHA